MSLLDYKTYEEEGMEMVKERQYTKDEMNDEKRNLEHKRKRNYDKKELKYTNTKVLKDSFPFPLKSQR